MAENDKLSAAARALLPYGFLLNSWVKSADGKVAVDSGGRILAVSDEVMPTFGYSQGEMVGQPVEMLIPEALAEKHREYREGYARHPKHRPMGLMPGSTHTGVLRGRRKDGTEFPCAVNLVYYYDADGLRIEATVRVLPDA